MAEACGYDPEVIRSRKRDGMTVIVRALIWLTLRNEGYKLTDIATATGRTHGTVINGLKKIKGYIAIGDKLTLVTLDKIATVMPKEPLDPCMP